MEFFIDLLIVGISVGMIYALVALGISLIYSGLDIVHFAHGEIYMFGAFLWFGCIQRFGVRLPPGVSGRHDHNRPVWNVS